MISVKIDVMVIDEVTIVEKFKIKSAVKTGVKFKY